MAKWWLLLAALILWLACGYAVVRPQEATSAAGTAPGRPPMRIISMAPNLTEILFALGLDAKLAGITQDSDYPPGTADIPKVGTFWQPNVEAVIAARPDLVVALAFEQHRDLARRLRRMGYNCLVVHIEKVDDLFAAIAVIGDATGAAPQATQLRDRLKAEIDQVRATTAGMPRVKVLWVVQRDPLRVAGRDTFINELIELAGGENAIGPTLQKYPSVGAEQVIAAAPEVIIEPTMGGSLDEQHRQASVYWRRFAKVPAAAGERVYVIDGDMVSRLSPRLPAGIATIARCLRPELFGE